MLELIMPMDLVASPVMLSPSQQRAADGVMRGLERGDCAVLQDRGSNGKTTVLGYVHRQLGGVLIGVRKFLAKLAAYEPAAIEEAFLDLFDEYLAGHVLLIVDDLHLVKNVVESCDYIRQHLFDAVLTAALQSPTPPPKKELFPCDDIPIVLPPR